MSRLPDPATRPADRPHHRRQRAGQDGHRRRRPQLGPHRLGRRLFRSRFRPESFDLSINGTRLYHRRPRRRSTPPPPAVRSARTARPTCWLELARPGDAESPLLDQRLDRRIRPLQLRLPHVSTRMVIEVFPTRTRRVQKLTMSPTKTGRWNSTLAIATETMGCSGQPA
jgi:hypothetical protein